MVQGAGETKSAIQNGQVKRMKNGAIYFKWTIVLIGIIAIVYLSRSCNCGKEIVKEVPNIVKERYDTTIIKVDTFIQKVPVPYKVQVPIENDSLLMQIAIRDGLLSAQDDTISVLRQYLTTRYYSDSFKISYGKIYTKDTVRANRIIGKGIATSLKIPEVIKTITIEAQKRNVVLFGVGLIGNKVSPLYGTEATIDFKTKSDKIYEAGGVLLRGGDFYYKASLKIPIKLK